MAIYRKNDLIERCLVRLGEIGFGQTAEPEARARAAMLVDGVLDELEIDQVYDFATSDEIPGAAFDPLVSIVAARLAPDFGASGDEVTLLAAQAQGARDRLIRYRSMAFQYEPVRVDYF